LGIEKKAVSFEAAFYVRISSIRKFLLYSNLPFRQGLLNVDPVRKEDLGKRSAGCSAVGDGA
jgi:hypothetical protein